MTKIYVPEIKLLEFKQIFQFTWDSMKSFSEVLGCLLQEWAIWGATMGGEVVFRRTDRIAFFKKNHHCLIIGSPKSFPLSIMRKVWTHLSHYTYSPEMQGILPCRAQTNQKGPYSQVCKIFLFFFFWLGNTWNCQ